jgi:glycosyltransferase involved in cell wall biosynthesis
LRRYFDAFVVYSSFSHDCLIELGEPAAKIFVATNVGEVSRFSRAADALTDNKGELRRQLQLPNRFTVLYAGSLDPNKRPDMMVELAARWKGEPCNFVVLGSGPLLEPLQRRVASDGLANVYLLGKVTEDLTKFYKAADVLVVPGRGGIIMSEAMATGLPVIVHQGDGTEFDLVLPEKTGYRLSNGTLSEFAAAITSLQTESGLATTMARNCRQLMQSTFTEANMVHAILEAARYASAARRSRIGTLRGRATDTA